MKRAPARRKAVAALQLGSEARYRLLAGVGGIGTGLFFALEGNHTLGRNESRPARQLDVRDYCKLHIIAHYVAVLLGADPSGTPFHVLPVGRVGDDDIGRRLWREMQDAGMDMRFVERVPGQLTPLSVCFQYPDGSGGNITVRAAGALAPTPEDIDQVEPYLEAERSRAIVLAAPEVPLEARGHLLRLGARHGAFCVASCTTAEMQDALRLGLFAPVDLLAVNEEEAAALAGQELDPSQPEAFLKACAAVLRPDARLVVTAGRHGAYAYESGTWEYCPAAQVPVVSTAGAGDALLAGVLVGLAAGLPLVMNRARRTTLADHPLASALDLGTLLAAFGVTSPHTIPPEVSAGRLAAFADEIGLQLSDRLSRLFPGRS